MSFADLEVHLRTPDDVGYLGRCLDIEPVEGQMLATVEFDAARAPLLPVGTNAELEFRAKGPDLLVHALAETVLRSDDAARRSYCFRGNLTKRVFLHLLGRRRAHRTLVPHGNAVQVNVLDIGATAQRARLYDVSATGLSIVMRPDVERQLVDREHVRLAVRLPGGEQELEIEATIRHRRLLGPSILYGLEVDGQIHDLHAQGKLALYVASLKEQGI